MIPFFRTPEQRRDRKLAAYAVLKAGRCVCKHTEVNHHAVWGCDRCPCLAYEAAPEPEKT